MTELMTSDDLLREMLHKRAARGSSTGLLEAIVAEAGVTAQQPPVRLGRRPIASWSALPVAAAVVLAIAVGGIVIGPRLGTGGPTPFISPAESPTPSAKPSPTPSPTPTPEAVQLGELTGQRLPLGGGAAPIDVISAFDSIWTADIHANDVRRFDPLTLEELARIPVPGGPAWFAEADGALWVSTQNGVGLTRIDPTSNTMVTSVGDDPPCGAPVVAFGDLWQSACDANVVLRIDPSANEVISRIPASGYTAVTFAGGSLVAASPDGLGTLDPETETFTVIGGPTGFAIGSDGEAVWIQGTDALLRVDPATAETLASFPYPNANAVGFGDGRAWLTVPNTGVLEIDLDSHATRRTIPVLPSPLVPREADGVLWVTDFSNSDLWRVQL